MTFAEYVEMTVGAVEFKTFYDKLQLKLPYDKFKKLPPILNLTVINQYLVIKFGIYIYNLPDAVVIHKAYIRHDTMRELITPDISPIIIHEKSVSIIPTDKDLIAAFNKIKVWLTDKPFSTDTSQLDW